MKIQIVKSRSINHVTKSISFFQFLLLFFLSILTHLFLFSLPFLFFLHISILFSLFFSVSLHISIPSNSSIISGEAHSTLFLVSHIARVITLTKSIGIQNNRLSSSCFFFLTISNSNIAFLHRSCRSYRKKFDPFNIYLLP